MHHESKVIDSIKRQFLQNVPVKQINWHNCFNFPETFQSELLQNTVKSKLILRFPPRIAYQKGFLKEFLAGLEKQGTEIADACYEEYARLVATPTTQAAYFKHYTIGNNRIILQENSTFISEGTTGLVTWQASLALTEWILQNPTHFHKKRILELGSGIGLTGLTLTLIDNIKSIILSDCHESVLKALLRNIEINQSCTVELEKACVLNSGIQLQVLDLNWEFFEEEHCKKLDCVDVIVAADVVYDKSLFKYLINTVRKCFQHCATAEFILSCSERNKDTLHEFLDLLSEHFAIRTLPVPKQVHFYWPEDVPVRLFSVSTK